MVDALLKCLYKWMPCAVVSAVSLTRCWDIELLSRAYLNRSNIYFMASLNSESLALGLFLVIYAVALSIEPNYLSKILRAGALIMILWMATDMLVFHLFLKRLDVSDVETFAQEYSVNLSIFMASFRSDNITQIVIFMSAVFLPFFWISVPPISKKLRWAMGFTSATLLIIAASATEVDTISTPQIVNTISYNLNYGQRPEYSAAYLERVEKKLSSDDQRSNCIPGKNLKSNLIVVMIESLSSYQSKRLSGLNNWTPELDAISKNGLVIDNFIANGFRTDLGLISTLTGRWPIIPPKRGTEPYEAFYSITDSLPNRLREHGYQTSVISGSPLSFLKSKEWFRSIGFEETIGPEENSDIKKRGVQNREILDEDLYEYTAKKISNGAKPLFQLVVTISTHPPFGDPVTGQTGEEAAFRYADRTFSQFYKNLQKFEYFKQGGILVVLGDHRALVPISQQERNIFQTSASARIPLVIFGLNKSQYERSQKISYFQQSDIVPSIDYLLSERSCFGANQANIFFPAQELSRCILHVRGDAAKYMNVFCNEQPWTVEFNGDKTRFLDRAPPQAQRVLDEMASSSVRLNRLSADK